MVLFEDCNVSGDRGTAKFTAIVVISGDDSFMPIVFNGVTLSTRRNGTNEWTAAIPDSGTLTINMASDEKMTLSGTVKYFGYDCGFSTVINKNPSNSIDPNTILNGTWTLNGTQGGGYLANGSQIIATAAPETVSISFSGTEENSQPSVKSFYSLRMRTSSTESHDETSMLQNISDGKGTLTNIHGNVYRLKESDGNGSIIFVENIDEIFVFQGESADNWQTCMFLPLKKISVDVEKALNKTWRASEGEGGGYIEINNNSGLLPEFLKDIGSISLTLKNSTLSFSGITRNDDGTITATVNIATSFSYTNDILEALNFPADSLDHNESGKITITPSSNFLQFEYDGDVYRILFLSDTEAFFSLESGTEGQGEAMYYVRLSAE